jgi:hypothetical protein
MSLGPAVGFRGSRDRGAVVVVSQAMKRGKWTTCLMQVLALVLFAVPVAERGLCCCLRADLQLQAESTAGSDCCAVPSVKQGSGSSGCCSSPGPVAAKSGDCEFGSCECCWSIPPGERQSVRYERQAVKAGLAAGLQTISVVVRPLFGGACERRDTWAVAGNRRQSVLCVWRN